MKPKIKITLVDRKGECSCHRGHKIGDSFGYDTQRGFICSMAMHVVFPYIDILRYGGKPSASRQGDVCFCGPDSGVINISKIEAEKND